VEQLVGWLAKMAIDGFLEGLKTAASILNGIKEVFDYISGKHPTIDINKGVPGAPVTSGNNFIGVPVPPENRHAKGGIITKPEIGLIGESGPEAIIPLSGTGMDDLTGGLVFGHEAFTVLHASSKVLNVNFEKVNDTVRTGTKVFTGFFTQLLAATKALGGNVSSTFGRFVRWVWWQLSSTQPFGPESSKYL